MTPMTSYKVKMLYALLRCSDVWRVGATDGWGIGIVARIKIERIKASKPTHLPILCCSNSWFNCVCDYLHSTAVGFDYFLFVFFTKFTIQYPL